MTSHDRPSVVVAVILAVGICTIAVGVTLLFGAALIRLVGA